MIYRYIPEHGITIRWLRNGATCDRLEVDKHLHNIGAVMPPNVKSPVLDDGTEGYWAVDVEDALALHGAVAMIYCTFMVRFDDVIRKLLENK